MGSYTCITCRVMFSGREIGGVSDGLDVEARAAFMQKEHYKTDWHRYNLKRKVAGLPPVTAENFQEKILAHKNQVAEENKSQSHHCADCGRHFNTQNAYTNHLQSKKHKEMVASGGVASKRSSISSTGKKPLVTQRKDRVDKDALNADLKKATQGTASLNLGKSTQSSKEHEIEDITMEEGDDDGDWEDVDDDDDEDDFDELKVNALPVEHCLFCPEVSSDLESNLKHMTIAHSFFIPDVEYVSDLEGLVAYLGEKVGAMRMCLWCNEKSRVYTELRAVQQHMTDKSHCKVFHDGDAVLEYADFYDYRSSYPDYKPGQTNDDDDELSSNQSQDTESAGYELVLPSGSTVGHRTLMRYYRQKLKPGRELVISANTAQVKKVMTHYKALGWLGTTGPIAQQKAKDIQYMNRVQSRHFMNLGIKQNKFQKNFRDDNFGIKH